MDRNHLSMWNIATGQGKEKFFPLRDIERKARIAIVARAHFPKNQINLFRSRSTEDLLIPVCSTVSWTEPPLPQQFLHVPDFVCREMAKSTSMRRCSGFSDVGWVETQL